ncbi:uncharacterized protein LOC103372761 [Stegastes partitus]|uniref:Uncharacterized protein LOC103372761 n=1 Tax=Stegastes partitus TaxID=144197 RepID=A0A9Y4TZ54_9TELE|nr:PREDICTED: uncharacterized protein LOC103372761 [Stegastes partitus]
MTFSSFFIIFMVHLGVVFNQRFQVTQPEHRTVNPDKTAFISCEHHAQVYELLDVRLNSKTTPTDRTMLCQKGMTSCENMFMIEESENKFTFILLNIGPEALNVTYECEFSLNIEEIHHMERGTPTRLLQGQKETEERCKPRPVPPPAPPAKPDLVSWILIGLLALTFLYSCIITSFYVRLMNSDDKDDCENSTYVEMRKASPQRNVDCVYSGVK